MNRLSLSLFITGNNPRSQSAVERLREAVGDMVEAVDLDIVDVQEKPDLAEAHRVLATPTLIRLAPLPTLRLVGDMSNTELLRQAMGVSRGIQRLM